MELGKKTEFWAVVLIVCLVVSVAVMLVDFGIKSAILEESNRLRRVIEEHQIGQRTAAATQAGTSHDGSVDYPFPSDLLVGDPRPVETRDDAISDIPED